MARPQADIEAGRRLLLETIETMIQERGAIELSMTELATAAGMSPSNVYRFFESKEAVMEAVAEDWFADKIQVMEEVVASDGPAKEKMLSFFGRRFVLMKTRFDEDPDLFVNYCALGSQHLEVIRGYIDLGDHYLAMIVADAMDQGHFPGLSIDDTVSLINQMVQPYCNPDMLPQMGPRLSEEKLGTIIDAIFFGLKGSGKKQVGKSKPDMQLVS